MGYRKQNSMEKGKRIYEAYQNIITKDVSFRFMSAKERERQKKIFMRIYAKDIEEIRRKRQEDPRWMEQAPAEVNLLLEEYNGYERDIPEQEREEEAPEQNEENGMELQQAGEGERIERAYRAMDELEEKENGSEEDQETISELKPVAEQEEEAGNSTERYNGNDEMLLIARWMLRNCNKNGSRNAQSAFVYRVLSLPIRQKLMVYYLIEKDLRYGDEDELKIAALDVYFNKYTPNYKKFKDRMIASKLKFWKRIGINTSIYWNHLEQAYQIAEQNKGMMDTIAEVQGMDAGIAEKSSRIHDMLVDTLEEIRENGELREALGGAMTRLEQIAMADPAGWMLVDSLAEVDQDYISMIAPLSCIVWLTDVYNAYGEVKDLIESHSSMTGGEEVYQILQTVNTCLSAMTETMTTLSTLGDAMCTISPFIASLGLPTLSKGLTTVGEAISVGGTVAGYAFVGMAMAGAVAGGVQAGHALYRMSASQNAFEEVAKHEFDEREGYNAKIAETEEEIRRIEAEKQAETYAGKTEEEKQGIENRLRESKEKLSGYKRKNLRQKKILVNMNKLYARTQYREGLDGVLNGITSSLSAIALTLAVGGVTALIALPMEAFALITGFVGKIIVYKRSKNGRREAIDDYIDMPQVLEGIESENEGEQEAIKEGIRYKAAASRGYATLSSFYRHIVTLYAKFFRNELLSPICSNMNESGHKPVKGSPEEALFNYMRSLGISFIEHEENLYELPPLDRFVGVFL